MLTAPPITRESIEAHRIRMAATSIDGQTLAPPAAAMANAGAAERFRQLYRGNIQRGMGTADAMREAVVADPEGHRAYISAANPAPTSTPPAQRATTAAAFRQRVDSLMAAGRSRSDATRQAIVDDPAGHRASVEEHTAKYGQRV